MKPNVRRNEKTKVAPRCETYACKNRSDFQIGVPKFPFSNYNLCGDCLGEVMNSAIMLFHKEELAKQEAERPMQDLEELAKKEMEATESAKDPEDKEGMPEPAEGVEPVPEYDDITLDKIKKRLDELGIAYTAKETKQPLYDRLIEGSE